MGVPAWHAEDKGLTPGIRPGNSVAICLGKPGQSLFSGIGFTYWKFDKGFCPCHMGLWEIPSTASNTDRVAQAEASTKIENSKAVISVMSQVWLVMSQERQPLIELQEGF